MAEAAVARATVRGRLAAALVTLGWNVVVTLATVLWIRSIPFSSLDDPCRALVFGCPRDAALLVWMLFGMPVLIVSTVLAPVLAWWRMRSGTRGPVAAGTWSAALGLVVSSVVVALALRVLSL